MPSRRKAIASIIVDPAAEARGKVYIDDFTESLTLQAKIIANRQRMPVVQPPQWIAPTRPW